MVSALIKRLRLHTMGIISVDLYKAHFEAAFEQWYFVKLIVPYISAMRLNRTSVVVVEEVQFRSCVFLH